MEKKPIGTCFFVVASSPNQERRSTYLVTARHVLRDLRGGVRMFVRLNKPEPGATKKASWWAQQSSGVEYVPLPDEGWREHPNDQVDLVVLRWWPPAEFDLTLTALPLQNISRAKNDATTFSRPWPPEEGEETVLMGLMLQHQGIERNLPMVRMGHVALNTSELIALTGGTSQYRIIEMQAFKGNSGAPVWTRFTGEVRDHIAAVRNQPEFRYEERFAFLGVLSTAFPSEFEVERTRGTTTVYLNYGISAVVPGEILVEHLNNLEA